jgi:hypothetical protein
MRAEVAESWHRSAAAGVSVDADAAPITLPGDELADYREAHPLAQVFPILDEVLGQAARDCSALMAVSDAAGQLLWVCGERAALRAAERIGFVEGSNWDERMAGTNAPGLALTLGRTATVLGREHFRHAVQRWSCAATPIHDPGTAAILGVLDITGSEDVVGPQAVALVRAAARMAESELARGRLPGPPAPAGPVPAGVRLDLQALGRAEALVTTGGGATLRMSRRHSEILVVLATAGRGLSGQELAALLYEGGPAASTLRAELNRLRQILGAGVLESRPYRLRASVGGDWLTVQALLAAGDPVGALRRYSGPLLPGSVAPGVARLRQEVEYALRGGVLVSGSPDLMAAWTRSSWGADDYEMWLALRRAVGATSPLASLVEGQLTRLDRELGA